MIKYIYLQQIFTYILLKKRGKCPIRYFSGADLLWLTCAGAHILHWRRRCCSGGCFSRTERCHGGLHRLANSRRTNRYLLTQWVDPHRQPNSPRIYDFISLFAHSGAWNNMEFPSAIWVRVLSFLRVSNFPAMTGGKQNDHSETFFLMSVLCISFWKM
jgi:hypothetical protein